MQETSIVKNKESFALEIVPTIDKKNSINAELSKIKDDYKLYTKKELDEKIKYLENRLIEVKESKLVNDAMQQGLKLSTNSQYGALANKYFACFNINVAAAITAQGRDTIKFMIKCAETYHYKKFHLDTVAHEKLKEKFNLTQFNKIDSSYKDEAGKLYDNPTIEEVEKNKLVRKLPTNIYNDTDSSFTSYQPMMDACGYTGDPVEFITFVHETVIGPLYNILIENYVSKFGPKTKCYHKFALENISETIIFLGKKMYVKNIIWEEGKFFKSLSNIIPKGVSLIKSDSPPFSRKHTKELVKFILGNPKMDNRTLQRELHSKLKELKKAFELSPIDEIAKITSVNGYDTYVLDDQKNMVFKEIAMIKEGDVVLKKNGEEKLKTIPYQVRAACWYNYLINNNAELKNKYALISSGDRVKYYETGNDDHPHFAYVRGSFPAEIAPKIDYDAQFEKCILNVTNDFVEALGMRPFDKKISYRVSLFSR